MRDTEYAELIFALHYFLKKIDGDERFRMSHMCLFMALMHLCKENGSNPFFSSRSKLMSLAKINAKTTYHKCLNDLVCKGFIGYRPSYNPKIGSLYFIVSKNTK
jgi:hypothetical protein